MKKLILLPVFLSLCAFTCQERPQTVIQRVYCVTPEQYKKIADAEPKKIGNDTTGDLPTDYKASVKQNVLMRQFADGTLEVLGGCIGPAQDK